MSECRDLEAVIHDMYSSVGTDTIARSLARADSSSKAALESFFSSAIGTDVLESLPNLLG
jgi:hypothetical protein